MGNIRKVLRSDCLLASGEAMLSTFEKGISSLDLLTCRSYSTWQRKLFIYLRNNYFPFYISSKKEKSVLKLMI